ncbi:PAS domain-containing protein [Rhodoplanes roseus]|uniref:PAS domain-containing protein n=1 Tax=Rhodoplanes roseus TaxID=29409 RepID=UPI0011B3D184|nr:PAS domain-containing protein [Rhodoplanes roseus]
MALTTPDGVPGDRSGPAASGGFPPDGGECGMLMRAIDWSRTPLGPIDAWPAVLRHAVDLILPSRAQIVMFWGPDFLALYNDAYAPTIGNKHPRALGRPARENWAELWDDLEPLLQRARAGETVFAEDRPFAIERRGFLETVWFDISYSPARGDDGTVHGVVCVVSETTERVLAERALRAANERVELALDAGAAVGTWDWDITADRVFADARFARLYGIDPIRAEAGAPISAFVAAIHPEDRAHVAADIARALRAGERLATEYRICAPGAPIRHVLARGYTVAGPDGRPARLPGVLVDVTEQRVAEQALRDLNETLERQVAERTRERDRAWTNAQDLLLVADADGTIRAVNPAWRTVLDHEPEDVVGTHLLDLVHPDDRHLAEELLSQGSPDGLSWEWRCRHRDGSYRWIGWRASAEAGLVYATGRDITRRREHAQALERSEARLRSVFETSYQYQGLLSPDGTLLDANPASLAGIMARREDVIGRPYWETPWFTGTPGLPEQIAAAVPRVAAGESFRREIVVDLPTGRRAFDFSLRPVQDAAGRVIAIMPEAMEVTERRAAEEQLRQAQKMEAVGQLTGGIAHDFNNLLTGIIGSIDILRRRIAAGRTDDLDRFFDAAATSAHRAAGLTHRLLAFSRRQSLDLRPIAIDGLIGSMEDLLHRTLGERIALRVERRDAVWPAEGDANQTENALLNFAINARDAMPDGGTLTITATNETLAPEHPFCADGVAPGDYVALRVTDTGTGMDTDVLERAFDPFFTTKPIGQGTGLGLSMAYGYAKQAGGHLHVASRPGVGTTVSLLLPRAARPVEATAPAADGPVDSAGETVLVVEDDPGVRLTVVEVLRELGYEALEAIDARTALPILHSDCRIDLLVSDVGLPGLDGRQIAELARQRRPGLKVLFITGYAENATVRRDFLGPDMELITKPFAVPDLAGRIRALIERAPTGATG